SSMALPPPPLVAHGGRPRADVDAASPRRLRWEAAGGAPSPHEHLVDVRRRQGVIGLDTQGFAVFAYRLVPLTLLGEGGPPVVVGLRRVGVHPCGFAVVVDRLPDRARGEQRVAPEVTRHCIVRRDRRSSTRT